MTNVMLAHPYDSDKHATKVIGWWMSIKYDGVRGKWNGKEMETRTGHIYTLPDFLTKQLESIKDEDGNPMELDGELWAGNDTFAFMSGMARRHENDDELWENITYMVFDTPDITMPFEDRVRKVYAALKRTKNLVNIKAVEYIRIKKGTSVEDELAKIEDYGGEGLVLRKPDSLYVFKRSQDMLKVKSWSYKEAMAIGYEEGSGKYSGMVGSLKVKSDEFGTESKTDSEWVVFKVGSGLNDWQRYSGSVEGNWKTKEIQNKIDNARKKCVIEIDKDSDEYNNILHTIKTSTGKKRIDAIHELNYMFMEMPGISFNNIITFRFKELTKDGNPSMPTFVSVRSDLEYDWEKRKL